MTDLEKRLLEHVVMPDPSLVPRLCVTDTTRGQEMSLTVTSGAWAWQRGELFYRLQEQHDVEADMAATLRHWSQKICQDYPRREVA